MSFNVNLPPHLWLWGNWRVCKGEGNTGGLRRENVVFLFFSGRCCEFLAHVLVNNNTSSWGKTQSHRSFMARAFAGVSSTATPHPLRVFWPGKTEILAGLAGPGGLYLGTPCF